MLLPQCAIDFVAPHCDIIERLAAIPPSARVRGIYFRSLKRELEHRDLLARYFEFFSEQRRGAMAYYPLSEFSLRLACAGALVASPAELHRGMHDLGRTNSSYFAQSLLGRAIIRFLSKDPIRLSEQGLAARRQSCSYGHWELVRRGPTEIEMRYENEYLWIESYVAGAAQGTFEACGVTPILETRLTDRFNGSTLIRW